MQTQKFLKAIAVIAIAMTASCVSCGEDDKPQVIEVVNETPKMVVKSYYSKPAEASTVTKKDVTTTTSTTTTAYCVEIPTTEKASVEDVSEEPLKNDETSEILAETATWDNVNISFDMDITKTTGLTQSQFVELMTEVPYDYNGYFERNAALIWELCNEKSINELAICGITAWESGWATVASFGLQNNYFGIREGSFSSEAEGLEYLTTLLAEEYLSEDGSWYCGKTITAVGNSYCDPYNWPTCVFECMSMIHDSKNK